HFRLPTGARGEIVICMAMADRAGYGGSDGGSRRKLLGVRRESRATLRLDDWHVGGPQLVSRDVECDSVLCVLLVVVSSRSPWSPFSTARVIPIYRQLQDQPPEMDLQTL
ncbi:hypothetical protein Taro_038150, partial [Colocasia esculenta]|nr:hypothetical protein [Colocasia esculenta]